ncbi:hypothetical protein GCM10010222_77110 [Streptomyces tanashiensis]|uniref:hypothetical protein n=1 Tax=Streptomyces tanashiensis TaxID=67367 RepID=UPI0016740E3F|nr:hypothetical protein [Streptomyces tanashiensis]GGT23814.1 hypothetical protein GCM10010222_77110 [Streptomyces tanashiensis]
MTEQILTEPVETGTSVPAETAETAQSAGPRKSRKPLLWGIVRWTAAVLVCGGIGAGTAMGITAMERTDVPGLATESDGRWEYPRLALPALPEGALRPYSDGNDGEIHHADLRKLLLPAPAGATVDPKLKGGWAGTDSYLALLKESDRGTVKEYLADSALRHVAARGWTTPDGTTTRIHLLRFSSVAFAEDFKDEVTREVSKSSRLPLGVEAVKIDMSVQDVAVPDLSVYAYQEEKPYGPEQTRWAYIQAGDTFGVVTQTRKGGTLTVPFQQTVALQSQLLG